MSITGAVRTARVFNPNVELRRTILSRMGEPSIHIHDRFVSRGNEPVPHAWMLHINFGYPLLEPGVSTFCYRGTRRPLGNGSDRFAAVDGDAEGPLEAPGRILSHDRLAKQSENRAQPNVPFETAHMRVLGG